MKDAVFSRKRISPRTRKVRRHQLAAKAVLWFFAGLTVAALTGIVGYIFVNGFYYRDINDGPVLSAEQESVPLDESEEFQVLCPKNLRLRNLDYQVLQQLVTGEQSYLGFLTGQNSSARIYIGGDSAFRYALADYLLISPDDLPPGLPGDPEDMIQEDRGTLLILPSSEALPRGAKRVPLRQYSVTANSFILELQGGRRLRILSEDRENQVSMLLNGDITEWSAVGGPSREILPPDADEGTPGVYEPLAVLPVLWNTAADTPAAPPPEVMPAAGKPGIPSGLYVSSVEGFVEILKSRRNALGVIRTREALQYGLSIIPVERVHHTANLRISTFLEPPSRSGAVGGLSYIIINTLVMIIFVIIIVTPIGVTAAVFFIEYSRQSRLVEILRIGTSTLAGVPSIIFGLFGLVFFSELLHLKTGLLAGSLTMTIMILPTVIKTSEEALKAVPVTFREASFALGATKLQTIFRVVLPAASPGILTGIILGIGRAIGETAALLFTMGSNLSLIKSFNSPMRVLSVHLYLLIRENISLSNAFAAATILVIIMFLVNFITTRLVGRLSRMNVG